MIKVYKPGEKRKSLSECGCAAQCAEGGGDELCAWDPCVCGCDPCCDRMAMGCAVHELVQQAGRRTSPCGAPRVARVEP
jgi:hypothetical protein